MSENCSVCIEQRIMQKQREEKHREIDKQIQSYLGRLFHDVSNFLHTHELDRRREIHHLGTFDEIWQYDLTIKKRGEE